MCFKVFDILGECSEKAEENTSDFGKKPYSAFDSLIKLTYKYDKNTKQEMKNHDCVLQLHSISVISLGIIDLNPYASGKERVNDGSVNYLIPCSRTSGQC